MSSFLAVFGCLKTSRVIFLAFNMLASPSDLRYFCISNVFFFQFFIAFFFDIFILDSGIYSFCKREKGIFFKQCRGWFGVNGSF